MISEAKHLTGGSTSTKTTSIFGSIDDNIAATGATIGISFEGAPSLAGASSLNSQTADNSKLIFPITAFLIKSLLGPHLRGPFRPFPEAGAAQRPREEKTTTQEISILQLLDSSFSLFKTATLENLTSTLLLREHRRMESARIPKENEIYSAEEKRAWLCLAKRNVRNEKN
uniref:Uncharacterized protein n=1 Tax=Glossina pallidipes TaxID=7398 RepID=A0A1A9ZDT7_GLOPL